MTQEEFDLLPGLLTSQQFKDAVGVNWWEFRQLKEAGLVTGVCVAKLCGLRKKKFRSKYPKWQAAAIGQWQQVAPAGQLPSVRAGLADALRAEERELLQAIAELKGMIQAMRKERK